MKYGGLDVHKSFIQVCILDRELESCEDFKIDSSRESLKELEQLLSETECIALEASSHWGWVVDELDDMGVEVVLSHPSKTKAIGCAKIKTDKIDARMLAYLLSAGLLPQAHIPCREVREKRSYLRYRFILVTARTAFKNRIHAILAGYGLHSPYKDVFCKSGVKWLGARKLGELHREQIDGYLEIIKTLDGLIAKVDEWLKPAAEQDAQARLLMSIKGISYYSALLILAEIDGSWRFSSAKHLVSYAGLCPSTRSSGGKLRHGHITRCGSGFLRWVLIQAAQKATWKSNPMHKFYTRIKNKKGHAVAKTAVARKLLESIYQMLKQGVKFDARAWA
ncbi:MAG: IS110 family transposase [Armatimonadetes bacterium]|nr:IS110 family transposase [Armatimonadota bacterium]